jgi:hypothetical protein
MAAAPIITVPQIEHSLSEYMRQRFNVNTYFITVSCSLEMYKNVKWATIVDGLVKTQTCTTDGYVQKFDIEGAVASTRRRRTCGTPSIGRSRGNAGDRTFYDAIIVGISFYQRAVLGAKNRESLNQRAGSVGGYQVCSADCQRRLHGTSFYIGTAHRGDSARRWQEVLPADRNPHLPDHRQNGKNHLQQAGRA